VEANGARAATARGELEREQRRPGARGAKERFVAAASPWPNVVLIGFSGAGKTTVGALLAARLGLDHRDIDAAVEALVGPIASFVAARGIPAFRDVERGVVLALPRAATVVSAGAGTVLAPANRRRLCDGAHVFFLDVPPAELARRLGALPPEQRHRPELLAGDPVLTIARELAARRPLYATLGTRIDATGTPAAVADALARRLGA
jgi:shikimate kinase